MDKPEDLEAWLAERKRRWPTTARVEEKKRKMEEAIARGQLLEPPYRANKRQRMDDSGLNRHDRGRGRGCGRGRGISSRGRGRAANHVRAEFSTTSTEVVAVPVLDTLQDTSDSSSEDDNDSPEVVSSKASLDVISVPSKVFQSTETRRKNDDHRPVKRPPPQPRKEPYNPFASHSTLLRNVCIARHFSS